MTNPVDSYLDAKLEKRAQRDQKHVELWQTWKNDPNPRTLKPLLKELEPVFGHALNSWKAPNVNPAAMKANIMQHAIKALDGYDPNRGASITTHVTNRIQKAKRFNVQAQNMAYIPEEKARYIGVIDAAKDQLYDEHGRDPTHEEIASIVGISPKRVKEIQGLRRADIHSSAFASDPGGYAASRDQEIIHLLRAELKPDEQKVYDYIYGQNGMPTITSTGELAKKLGKTDSQISRIKNRIAAEYAKYK